MSIAPLIIHVSSFFFPSGNHTRCLSSPRAKGCRNAVVNAAYLPLNCESCECKSGSLSLSLSPPIHVVVVNWHDFAVLPHLAPWLSGSSINKCMSVSILLHPPPPRCTQRSMYVAYVTVIVVHTASCIRTCAVRTIALRMHLYARGERGWIKEGGVAKRWNRDQSPRDFV